MSPPIHSRSVRGGDRQDVLQRDVDSRDQRSDQVHGGYGFTDEYPVSRFYRGARYGTLGGGTTETLKDLVGKKLMSDFSPVDGFLGMGTF
jgi:hypothetical protein